MLHNQILCNNCLRVVYDSIVCQQSDYWSKGMRADNTVLMWKTYQFLAGMPSELLTTLLTLCSEFSQLKLVTTDGGVLKNGAVQTTIVAYPDEHRGRCCAF